MQCLLELSVRSSNCRTGLPAGLASQWILRLSWQWGIVDVHRRCVLGCAIVLLHSQRRGRGDEVPARLHGLRHRDVVGHHHEKLHRHRNGMSGRVLERLHEVRTMHWRREQQLIRLYVGQRLLLHRRLLGRGRRRLHCVRCC